MDHNLGSARWAATTIVENAETLRSLSLGHCTQIAHDYAYSTDPIDDQMTTLFAYAMERALPKSDQKRPISLSLEY